MIYESSEHTGARRRSRALGWFTFAAVVVLAGISTAFGLLYFHSRAELRQVLHNPSTGAAEEAGALIKKVSVHMALPSEKPTIAVVENAKKLAGQAFFKHAHNGDKVLMYTQSKKAILYRPSEDKVIEVAYLNINSTKP